MRSSFRLAIFCTAAAAALLYAATVYAQGPQCPPGFVFDRLSGVGCVQEDCGQVSGSHFSYTGSCICNDGLKGCYQPVDYSGFDPAQCGPFCPVSALTACIDLQADCPAEEPAAAPPTAPGSQDSPADSAGAPPLGGDELSIEELTRILEESLIPRSGQPPGEWRQAAAALLGMLGVLIFILSLASQSAQAGAVQPAAVPVRTAASQAPAAPSAPPVEHIYDNSPGRIISGDEARRFLEQTGALDRLSRLRHGASWDEIIDAMRGDPGKPTVDDFAINWKDDGTPDLDNLVIVTPEPPPPAPPAPEPEEAPQPEKPPEEETDTAQPPAEQKKPPPEEQKPPDLKELLERARKERDEALAKKVALLVEALKLSQQLRQARLEWDHTRVKAITDGMWDMADIWGDLYKVNFLATENFGEAYLKDLIKSTLKNITASGITYLALGEQPVRLTPEKLLEELQKPTGFLTSADYEALNKDPNKAKEYLLDVALPGGGLKQVIQNALEQSGPTGKGISRVYGPGETAVKGIRDAMRAKEHCAELRAQMVKIQERLGEIRSSIEDAQMDYDVADSAVKRNEANIAELKQMFPHRFAHL